VAQREAFPGRTDYGMAVTSMLIAALNNVPDCYSDVPVVFACVRLRGLAPASIEQRLSGGHTGRRWGGLGAADTGQCGRPTRSAPAPKSEYLL
jgi:hypothetical protein